MTIQNLYPGLWGSNCYLLQNGTHAAVVDPSADAQTICNELAKSGATLDFILLTHGHFDHIVSIDALREKTKAPVYIHQDDLLMPEDANRNAFYTFFHMERKYRRPEKGLCDGEILLLGDQKIEVLHTPGHTLGGACFLCNDDFLITGDTLFANSYGRTDLYGGSDEVLFHSLNRLRSLDPKLTIYPGHGQPAILCDALNSVLP